MNIFGTLTGWARSAWGAITGAATAIPDALEKAWRFVQSVYNTLGWLVRFVLRSAIVGLWDELNTAVSLVSGIPDALGRLAAWVDMELVKPLRAQVLAWLAALKVWTAGQIAITQALEYRLYDAALKYTWELTGTEHDARVKDVDRARAQARQEVAAMAAALQAAAIAGYQAGDTTRSTVLQDLAETAASRAGIARYLTDRLISLLIDLETTDNPVERWVAVHLAREITGKLGVDHAVGDMLGLMLGQAADQGKPRDLRDVIRDLAGRITTLEGQWAQFYKDGGTQVEEAGTSWKIITDLGFDAALAAFFTASVTDPVAWARDLADVAGPVMDDTLGRVLGLIR